MKDTALNYIKGFMAVSLFSVLPINLYSLSVSLQSSFGSALSGITNTESIGMTAQEALTSAVLSAMGDPIVQIFCVIMMGYAVIKVFFGNLKRGGILVIQIAVGSLYMFSVPRGYIDGFTQWCKQVIGICLTAFLQATILTAGLMIFKDHPLLGLGSTENCRTVWNGYQHQSKPDERSLCGAGSDQHIQDNRESSGGIRWCNGEKTGKSV